MNKFILGLVLIFLIMIIGLLLLISEERYNIKQISAMLKDSNISLVTKDNSKIQFIDGQVVERNLDFYNENIKNIQHNEFANYCCFYICSNHQQAELLEKKLNKPNNTFRELNIVFFTNEATLQYKYFKKMREWEVLQ